MGVFPDIGSFVGFDCRKKLMSGSKDKKAPDCDAVGNRVLKKSPSVAADLL